MLQNTKTIKEVQTIVNNLIIENKDLMIDYTIEKLDCKTFDEVVAKSFTLGLDCGWAKVAFDGDAYDHIRNLHEEKYGYKNNAIFVPNVFGVQSVTVQRIALEPIILLLAGMGINAYIDTVLD